MAKASTPDRRKNTRLPSSGPVEIEFDAPASITVHGELIDLSAMGFRAAHQSSGLVAGTEVCFRWEGASGRARVIWTHILQGNCVSGFLLL